jgi:hypothetical protein
MTEESEIIEDAEGSLRRLLTSANPYDTPLNARIRFRAIVAPLIDQLTEAQWNAIVSAANDEPFVWCATVGSEMVGEYWPTRSLEEVQRLETFDDYQKADPNATYALWSPRSSWVLLVSEQWFGIVGGSQGFMHRLHQLWPAWPGGPNSLADNLLAFVRNEREALHRPWLAELLTHVYGADEASNAIETVESERSGA